ncbi:polyprenyl synthetase family protein [Agitococcus lubricus]|uniref:Octaprenyl diphosphate synthase n=1 Tax=Agitococcus lubricus TaxID=1077255 RepID=A0A2T5IYU0_9GAMM|nr:polyprenyl synthetase family protein [Agitococcus lubricus]PTQ89072.1 octaprenyl-diphosphate synthase [Agitococcus lubricus]
MNFQDILATVATDFTAVDDFILNHLDSRVPLIMQVGHYLVEGGGKRLRPLVCLLAAKAAGYQGSQHIPAAAIIEMLHTATLIHDDVVDESDLRRGRATVNSAWNNATAVLVGDFLISRAFQLIVSLKNQTISEIMSDSTCIIAEGEVLQLINQRDPDTTEARYMDVIYGKTAQLFVAATETGAVLGNESYREALKKYAIHFGAAFQIIDDVMDYTSSADIMGKNLGDDLAEGKPTLPLIQAIKMAAPEQAEQIRNAIKTGGLAHLAAIIETVKTTGALVYCRQRATEESQLAIAALADLPESIYKQALVGLAELALNRVS